MCLCPVVFGRQCFLGVIHLENKYYYVLTITKHQGKWCHIGNLCCSSKKAYEVSSTAFTGVITEMISQVIATFTHNANKEMKILMEMLTHM